MKKKTFIILGIGLAVILIVCGVTVVWFYSQHVSYKSLMAFAKTNYDFDITYEDKENVHSHFGNYILDSNMATIIDDEMNEQQLSLNLYEVVLKAIPYQKYYKKNEILTGSFDVTSLKQNNDIVKFLPKANNFTCEFEITDNYLSSISCDDDSYLSISFFSNN